jgi:cell division protein FtsB
MMPLLNRDDRGRSDIGLRRKAATLACVILVVALVVGALFGDRGFLQLVRERQRADELTRAIEDLRQENGRLASEIAALRRDPRAIERLAREELGLARPGETVFLVREEPGTPAH